MPPSDNTPANPATDDINAVAFVSLGCPKNLVDSEKMLGLLAEDGLLPVSDEADADAIVVNTCGFLESSKEESIDVINQAAELKERGVIKRIVVAGCLVQRHRAKMLEWCPDIDAMVGVFDRDHIVAAVRGGQPSQDDLAVDVPVYSSIASSAAIKKQRDQIDSAGYFESDAARLRLTPRHYAYLRISEGCNQNCAFCTIPSIRGKMRSKPLDALLTEARELLADGAFELNLIGQDTTSFGDDIAYTPGLVGMLTELDRVATEHGGAWLRLMYAYPSAFTDEMIDTLAKLPNVLKYIDMPLQHINDRLLTDMRRRTSRDLIVTLLDKLRDRVPNIAIRTTFITGYPTETDAEHRELLDFIRDFRFDNLGAFPYSPEPGTPAGTLYESGGAIDEDTVAQRYEDIMLTQQQVVFDRNEQLVRDAARFDLLIDEETETPTVGDNAPNHSYIARTFFQAPDIDAITVLQTDSPYAIGEVVPATITRAVDYDLVARPTAEFSNDISLPVV